MGMIYSSTIIKTETPEIRLGNAQKM